MELSVLLADRVASARQASASLTSSYALGSLANVRFLPNRL